MIGQGSLPVPPAGGRFASVSAAGSPPARSALPVDLFDPRDRHGRRVRVGGRHSPVLFQPVCSGASAGALRTPAAVATPVHWWGVLGSPALSAHRRDRCRCHHRPPGRPQRAHSLPADSARYPDPGRAAMLTNPGDPRTRGAARRGPGPGPTGGAGAGVDRRSGTATGVASSRGAVDCSAAAPDGHWPVTAAARRPGTAAPV